MMSETNIAGSIYGVALGDALGRPTEFMNLRTIHKMFGQHGLMSMPTPALFTDDTQMTIRVANALWYARSLTPRECVRTLRQEFIDWAQNDEPRAPGITCMSSIQRMIRHPRMSWFDATTVSSKGCGANMRVAPTAFIRDEHTALGTAVLQAAMTHAHPVAITATELTALAIRWSAYGMEPNTLVAHLLNCVNAQLQRSNGGYRREWLGNLAKNWPYRDSVDGMQHGWHTCARVLTELQDFLAQPFSQHSVDICDALNHHGWVAEEALTLGLYFAIRYQNDPVIAISEAARTSGDSDSIASITGAIIGAYAGENAWPEDWRNRIERHAEIEQTIDGTVVLSR